MVNELPKIDWGDHVYFWGNNVYFWGTTMLGANLSDQIPGDPNLTLTLTLDSN